jgi:SAM-dependent methyltransferase
VGAIVDNGVADAGIHASDFDMMRAHWDEDYLQKGRLYGGCPREMPAFASGTRVLDIGCGDGKSLRPMLARGWDVTAVDFSFRAVHLARQISERNRQAECLIADAKLLPFRDNSFDAVTAIHLLGHCPPDGLPGFCREIDRVLRPGGRIFVVVFSTQDFRCGSGREVAPRTFVRGNGIMTRYFTEPEVLSIFSDSPAESVKRVEWVLRVRGRDYPRSEIAAIFSKHGKCPPV